MSIFELAHDEHGRPALLVEDIQRWLLTNADHWQQTARGDFWNGAVFTHTALAIRSLATQLAFTHTIHPTDAR